MYSGTCSILVWLARLVAYWPYSRNVTSTCANTYCSASVSGTMLDQLQ